MATHPTQPKPTERSKNRRWRLAAVGVLGCVLPLSVTAVIAWGVLDFAASVRRGACFDSAEYYRNALMMYAQDYDGRLPPANRWADSIFPYTKLTFDMPCPSRPKAIGPYAFNASLDMQLLARVGPRRPLLFESNASQRNYADLLESFARPHKGKGWVILGDGAVNAFKTPPDAK
jgi:hypothetical protein